MEVKELKSDVGELNQFLKTDEGQPVKEVMLTEVNTIPSLYESIREQTLNEAKWSGVVVGKQKIRQTKTGKYISDNPS
jgi:hypothetical protein